MKGPRNRRKTETTGFCLFNLLYVFSVLETFRFLGVLIYEGAEKQSNNQTKQTYVVSVAVSVVETFRSLGVLNFEGADN